MHSSNISVWISTEDWRLRIVLMQSLDSRNCLDRRSSTVSSALRMVTDSVAETELIQCHPSKSIL